MIGKLGAATGALEPEGAPPESWMLKCQRAPAGNPGGGGLHVELRRALRRIKTSGRL
jgi:hypothetical protein